MTQIGFKKGDTLESAVAAGRTQSNTLRGSVVDEVFKNADSGTIVKGQWVLRMTLGRSVRDSDGVDSPMCVGVAMEDIQVGDWGRVRRSGLIDSSDTDDGAVTANIGATAANSALYTGTLGTATGTAGDHVVGNVIINVPGTLTIVDVRCI
jgi:hypothetical protein